MLLLMVSKISTEPSLATQLNSFIKLMERNYKDVWVGADVGACIGIITHKYAEIMKHVYSFEPDPHNYKLLKSNFNEVKNVTTVNLAVCDEINELDFLTKSPSLQFDDNGTFINHPWWGIHRCGLNKEFINLKEWDDCSEFYSIKVPSTTLDEYFKDIFVDFIKIDVEGAEWDVFKGAQKLLEERDIIYQVEFHNERDWHKRKFLYDREYDIYDLDFNKLDRVYGEMPYHGYISKEEL